MLTGQAKTDYQREYMKRYRLKTVRPSDVLDPVRPEPVRPVRPKVKEQSYNSMMVGYVPKA